MVYGIYFWSARFAPESLNSKGTPRQLSSLPCECDRTDGLEHGEPKLTHTQCCWWSGSQNERFFCQGKRDDRIHHLAACFPPFIIKAHNTITLHKPRFEWHHSLSLGTVACDESVQSGCAECDPQREQQAAGCSGERRHAGLALSDSSDNIPPTEDKSERLKG